MPFAASSTKSIISSTNAWRLFGTPEVAPRTTHQMKPTPTIPSRIETMSESTFSDQNTDDCLRVARQDEPEQQQCDTELHRFATQRANHHTARRARATKRRCHRCAQARRDADDAARERRDGAMPTSNEAGDQRERRGRKELPFQDGEDRSA